MQGRLAQVRKQVRTYASRTLDGVLMYPGEYVETWIRVGALPWQLLSIEAREAK